MTLSRPTRLAVAILLMAAAATPALGQVTLRPRQPSPRAVSVPRSAPLPAQPIDSPSRALPPVWHPRDAITFTVIFTDPTGELAPYADAISASLQAAGVEWAAFLSGSGNLSIEVHLDGVGTVTGRSFTTGFVRTQLGINLFEQGAAAELRTGIDPNGADPDIEIAIDPVYLANELWFDPSPLQHTAPVPADRIDARSVFLHELGHAIAFNGWRDGDNGDLPGDYESTLDQHVFFATANLYFAGALSSAIYSGTVPMTFGNYPHLGNALPRPGYDLIGDLMNGVVFFRGHRYFISDLDLAIMQDSEVGLMCHSAIAEQPSAVSTCSGGTAGFSVAVSGTGPLNYRWRRNNVPVFSAFNHIAGADTPTLTISHDATGDAGSYNCAVTNACATIFSNPATLTVNSADFNGDGDTGTDADIEAFFACLAGTCCPSCGSADFNSDGDVGTDADIESFFRVLAGGNC